MKDEWLCGYAAALGAIVRGHREFQLVVMTMQLAGITVERLRSGGVEDFDLSSIEAAWSLKGPK